MKRIIDMSEYTDTSNLTRSELIAQLQQKDEQIAKLQSFIVDSDFYGVLSHFLLPVFLDDPNPETTVNSTFFKMYMHELAGLLSAMSKNGFYIKFTEANKALNKYRKPDGSVNSYSTTPTAIRGYKSITYEESEDLTTHVRTSLWPVLSHIDFFDGDDNRYSLNVNYVTAERNMDSSLDDYQFFVLSMDKIYTTPKGERFKRFNDSAISVEHKRIQLLIDTIRRHHDSLVSAIEDGYQDMITDFLNDHRKNIKS